MVHSYAASNSWMQSTSVVVAHVNKGDDVFVKTSEESQGEIYSAANSRTMFAGWKQQYYYRNIRAIFFILVIFFKHSSI